MGYLSYLTTFVVVAIAVLTTLFSWNTSTFMRLLYSFGRSDNPIEAVVAHSWGKHMKQGDFHNIAVGVNGNVDLIIQGTSLLSQLDSKSNSSTQKHVDHNSLKNLNDLQETFGFFHKKGAGGERYMESFEEFQHILKVATNMPETQYFIGGNAALMAEKFASLVTNNGEVLIGCPVGPVLKPLLNPKMKIAKSHTREDEYHMILEYSKNERWDGHSSPIASRFIFSHDESNSKMIAMEEFIASLKDFKPDLVVLSGFHLLEANKETFWRKRISEIAELIRPLSKDIPIHVELASMANKACMKELMEKIFPLADSIGLNEQELWLVCQAGGGPHCSQTNLNGPPPIPQAADITTWMLRTFSSLSNSRVTRVHFHTLTYHIALTVGQDTWQNQQTSVLAGTRTAASQACDDDPSLRPDKFELRISDQIELSATKSNLPTTPFNPRKPVTAWQSDNIFVYLSPVLVCRHPVKTVGLGDAISASGLIHSRFSRQP